VECTYSYRAQFPDLGEPMSFASGSSSWSFIVKIFLDRLQPKFAAGV
jgi:hypothetical protein